MSTLRVSTIQNASSSTANLTLDASGNATVGNTLVMGSSFKRNRIINGNMAVDQRNNGSAATLTSGAVTYFIDRWYGYQTGASVTGQRISSPTSEFQYAARITGATGNTFSEITQRIESINSADLAGKNVTVSFYCSSSALTTVNVFLVYPNSTDNYSATTVIGTTAVTINSTITRYSVTFSSMPSQVANGLLLGFGLSSGIGNGVTFTITGVQLEVGSVATPYERQIYSDQLAQCQRYYLVNSAGNIIYSADVTSGRQYFYGQIFQVQMRVAPTTLTLTNLGAVGFPSTASSTTTVSVLGFQGYRTANATGQGYFWDSFTASAEL